MTDEQSPSLTGYPSIDKPWMKYYDEATRRCSEPAEKRTVWQEIRQNNADYGNGIALEFFGARISFQKLFDNVEKCASALKASGVSKGDVVTIVSAGTPELVFCSTRLPSWGR